MKLFRAIYIEPPFVEWGFYRTVSIPLWRVAEEDCNVAAVTVGKFLPELLTCFSRWGVQYKNTYPTYANKFCVVGVIGNPPEPDYTKSPFVALGELPGPRLAMNYNRMRQGWQSWRIWGWPDIDPYAYPIRHNHVEVNYETVSRLQEIRETYLQSTKWRFRVGDLLNELAERMLLKEAIDLAMKATGLSYDHLESMANIAQMIPPDERSGKWSHFVQMLRRKKM